MAEEWDAGEVEQEENGEPIVSFFPLMKPQLSTGFLRARVLY